MISFGPRLLIIPTGDDKAISFTDDSSPDARLTGGDKVFINGQVNRDLSLGWYYQIIQLFPDVQGELKSTEVVERFRTFPTGTRDAIWAGLARVKIHIVDPKPHRHKINNILRKAWRNEDAPKLLQQWEKEGLPWAQPFSQQVRAMVADSILQDSTAMRVQFWGRHLLDPFGIMRLDNEVKRFFARSARPSSPLISTEDFPERKGLIRDVASWAAKSSAAFHSALDAVQFPNENDVGTYRVDVGDHLRRKMAEQLLPVHAFDKGNQKQLDLLEDARSSLFQEMAAHDRIFGLATGRRGIISVESKESFYIQAADIAAGIGSHIYATEGLIGAVERFEYVTYNGERVSHSDAEQAMRELQVIDI
jgi:hypothetical protein